MSKLEVLYSRPPQKKYLLIALGALDSSNSRLIFFPVDTSKYPPFPSFVSFQIPFQVDNAIIS